MSFGNLLKHIRQSKGLTQRAAADKIEMDYAYWSKLEGDKFDSLPTAATINRLARALNCTHLETKRMMIVAGHACNHSDDEIFELRELREVCGMYCEKLPYEVRMALHRVPEIEKTHRCKLNASSQPAQ